MINQLTQTFTLTPAQQTHLNGMLPFNRDDWESGTKAISDIRDSIGNQLRAFQNGICCYCGLKYDESGQGQIEHIAPKKGRPREYPEFSFHHQNLAMACQLCNSKTMKGEYNSIDVYDPNYSDCTFRIVHPYLDDHSLHYNWSYGVLRVVITGISNEGRESIRLFKLAGEHRTSARAKQRTFDRLVAIYNLPQNTINRIKAAINFRNQ
jgi:uncharacterized protein (TIGR02646 family)